MAGSSSTIRILAAEIGMTSSVGRQQHRECAAASGLAVQENLAAMGSDDLVNHRETYAGALDVGVDRGAAAHELFENRLLFRSRNTDARVDHTNRRTIAVLAALHTHGRLAG